MIIFFMGNAGVGRFTPLITGRQRQRTGRGGGGRRGRGRPPGSGTNRSRVMTTSGSVHETIPSTPEIEIGFLSPESSRLSDIPSNTGITFCLFMLLFPSHSKGKSNLFIFFLGEETPSTSQDPSTSPAIKRRPGRPRLKPVGPAHQGSRSRKSSPGDGSLTKIVRRGAPSGPRVIKPLPVPIGAAAKSSESGSRTSTVTPSTSSPSSIKGLRPTTQGYYGSMSP